MIDATVKAGECVAAEVRAWLARRQMSAQQAAARIGWTQTYLSRRLTSIQQFSPDDLVALAELLEVPVTRFFEWPEEVGPAMGFRNVDFCDGIDSDVLLGLPVAS